MWRVAAALLAVALLVAPVHGNERTVVFGDIRGIVSTVAGVWVGIETSSESREAPRAWVYETGQSYRLEFTSVPGRSVNLIARAHGYAPVRQPLGQTTRQSVRVDLEFRRGGLFSGAAIDVGGRRIRGAWVEVESPVAFGRWESTPHESRVYRVEADAEGFFQLVGLDAPRPRVVVGAEGFIDREVDGNQLAEAKQEQVHEVLLDRAGHVSGVVEVLGEQAQRPVVVEIGSGQRAQTDDGGNFVIGPFAVGSEVWIEASDGVGVSEAVRVPVPRSGVALEVRKGGSFSCRVVDESGIPVNHFDVVVTASTRDLRDVADEYGFAGSGGQLTIESLDWRATRLHVSADGYVPTVVRIGVDAQRAACPGPIVLRRGATVRGMVLASSSGAPVSDAKLSDGQITGEDGRFRLEGVILPTWLTVEAEGYADTAVKISETTTEVVVRMSRGTSIGGVVRTVDGMAVVGDVIAWDIDGGSRPRKIVRTTPDGAFMLEGLPPGRYRLRARSTLGSSENVTVSAGPLGRNGVVIAFAPASTVTGVVSGLVGDEELVADLLADVRNWVGSPRVARAEVANDGTFSFGSVATGVYDVRIKLGKHGRLVKRISVDGEADQHVEFEVGRSSLSGRVTRSGKPVDFAEVRVWLIGSDTEFVAPVDVGHYSITDLPSGAYETTVLLAALERGVATGPRRMGPRVDVSGDTTLDIDWGTDGVEGRVVSGNAGLPMSDVQVWLAGPGVGDPLQGETADDGRFQFIGIETGRYVVTAFKPGFAMARRTVDADSGYATELLLVPEHGRSFSVVNDESGRLPSEAYVRIVDMAGPVTLRIPLDESGLGRLPSAAAGKELMVLVPGFTPVSVRIWDGSRLEVAPKPR